MSTPETTTVSVAPTALANDTEAQWVPGITLRPYQQEANRCLWKAISEQGVRRAAISMPTGGGKTATLSVFCARIIRKYGGPILWIAHRRELLDQAEKAFYRTDPSIRVTRWDADNKDDSGDVVVASIGSTKTLSKRFLVVVIDEGHHAAVADEDEDDYENLYIKLLNRIQWSHLLLISATLQRLDGRSIAADELVYSVTFLDLVKKRRLARPIYVEMTTEEKALLQVRGGEFTKKSLQTLDSPSRNGKIADEFLKHRDRYGKTLMFVTSVEHCESMKRTILEKDPNQGIRCLTGKDLQSTREEVLSWFSQGDPKTKKLLINCEIFTEGYDEPTIKSVFLTRPTMSKGLWMQMVGRGARIVMTTMQVCARDIVKREPAGDDGIKHLTFSNGVSYYGEDLGTAYVAEGGVEVRNISVQTDDEFYLVNVMDDITKFHALVEEWQLEVRERTKEELEILELQDTMTQRRLQLKVLKDAEISEEEEALGELTDAQVRDLIGVLVISTYYHKNIGIPCDFDRTAVVKRLMDFARDECVISESRTSVRVNAQTGLRETITEENEIFDVEKYKNAYTHCITQAEFPKKIFELVRVAYYFRYIQGRQRVRYQHDQQMYETWKFIPLADITPESRSKHMEKATAIAAEAKRLNDAFNTEYSTPEKQKALIVSVFDAVDDLEGVKEQSKKKVRALRPALQIVHVKDRRISFFASVEVTDEKAAGMIGRAGHTLTLALQQVLDDPSALVIISPKRSTWDSTGEAVGATA